MNLLYAQKTNSFDILITGNTSEFHDDDKLIEKWQIASQNSENRALLMLGNIYKSEESKFSKEIILDNKIPAYSASSATTKAPYGFEVDI